MSQLQSRSDDSPVSNAVRSEAPACHVAGDRSHHRNGPRDVRGGFKSSGLRTQRKSRNARIQREAVIRRANLKKVLFEKYLHAFFLQGSDNGSLPAARSRGPLVEIYNDLILKNFRLGKPDRYAQTHQYYLDGGHLRNQSGNDSEELESRLNLPLNPSMYKGCRLPLISMRMTEMEQVRSMLEYAAEKKALVCSVDEAMTIAARKIDNYRSGRNNSQRISNTRADQSTLCSTCISILCSDCQGRCADGSTAEQSTHPPGGHQEEDGDPPDHREPSEPRGSDDASRGAENPDGQRPNSSEDDRERSRKLQAVLETAKVDENFLMLRMVFDEQREVEFGAFCREYCEQLRRRRIEPTNLVKEVFRFAQSRRNGNVNTTEHRDRERNLRVTMQLFEAARASI